MPVFAHRHGTLIIILVLLLLQSSLAQHTKLLSVKQASSSSSTSLQQSNETNTVPTPPTMLYPVRNSNFSRSTTKNSSSTRRSRQSPDSSYPILPNDFTEYSMPPTSYNYPDYQSTYTAQTITYPYLTTPRPTLHTLHHRVQPYSTKLSIKPIRHIPIHFSSDESVENDFVPLTPVYASADPRWSVIPVQHAYPVRTAQSHVPNTATGWSASGLSLTGATSSGWGEAHESNAQHVAQQIIPITIHEIQHDSRIDFKKWGIIALVKIGLAKLKAFGILKMLFFLLLKYKLILLVLFTKFVLFMKAVKLLKALLIPFLLLALLPLLLLLLPLLLIPLLLPLLLLLLPIPVPALVRDKNGNPRISVLSHMRVDDTDVIMDVLSQLLDSEQCVERIACQLATKKASKVLQPIVNWYLRKLGNVIKSEKIRSYVKAYTKTVKEYDGDNAEHDGQAWCARKYACAKVSSGLFVDGENNVPAEMKKSK